MDSDIVMFLLYLEVVIWFLFAGACYRFSEYGLWLHKFSDRSFIDDPWWRNQTKRNWFHNATFSWFLDSYHFFRNLTRILLSIRICVFDIWLGIVVFLAWDLGITVGEKLMRGKVIREKHSS